MMNFLPHELPKEIQMSLHLSVCPSDYALKLLLTRTQRQLGFWMQHSSNYKKLMVVSSGCPQLVTKC